MNRGGGGHIPLRMLTTFWWNNWPSTGSRFLSWEVTRPPQLSSSWRTRRRTLWRGSLWTVVQDPFQRGCSQNQQMILYQLHRLFPVSAGYLEVRICPISRATVEIRCAGFWDHVRAAFVDLEDWTPDSSSFLWIHARLGFNNPIHDFPFPFHRGQ